MSEYFDLIQARESCRDFDPARPVEREKLEKCIEAARLAPSACNSQPWKFYVVTDPARRAALCQAVQENGMNKFADNAPVLTVVVQEEAALAERAAKRFGKQGFADIDIGLTVSQYCCAATEQGLSTCILGWLNEEKIRALLDIPSERRVRLVIPTGYAANGKLRTKTRKATEEMAVFLD